ncbi:MAG: Holliday junction branch migration protein RuvA [Victivallaceae bacterium]|nr:Holliday junction branch migration protein RuvA [Victivallaceae bacterium]
MIARLSGKLADINFTQCIIDVNGVGYQVFIPMSTFDKLPREEENVSLVICTQVREDAISLYGFATMPEKQLFEILIGTTGVGPKLALSILSSMPVERFSSAIINADLDIIKRISGIGKKTAERLIVELKDKLAKVMQPLVDDSSLAVSDEKALAMEDAVAALEQLGFKRETVRKALEKIVNSIPGEEATSENFIRKALQALNS